MKILYFIPFLLIGCQKAQSITDWTNSKTQNDTIVFAGKTVDFIGNSITLGNAGVSPQSNRWPTVFSTLKSCTENNMGISGQALQQSGCGYGAFDRTTIPTYTTSRAAIFIALGINDVGFNTPSTTSAGFRLLLDSVVDYAHTTKGWPLRRIILVSPYWITNYAAYDAYTGCGHVTADVTRHETYVAAVAAVASYRNTPYADIYTAMKNSPVNGTFLSADGLHPNNTGAAFIANYFAGLTFPLSQNGGMGTYHSTLNNLFQPLPGILIIRDTQTVNGWTRAWSQEATMFYDSSTSNVKIYFTGGNDSLGGTAFNNKIGLSTSTDMITFTTAQKVIGQGLGGAAVGTRATSSWVGKYQGTYYAMALNGYGIGHAGEDRNIYTYTSPDGISWSSSGVATVNKSTCWTSVLQGLGNTAVVVDKYNTPVQVGGKFIALIEAMIGGKWLTYKAEATSLTGNWTFTDSLPTLQVAAPGGWSAGCVIYNKGVYHNFYHYACCGGGSYPSYLAYATSTNLVTWSVKEAPFEDLTYFPLGPVNSTNQIGDPYITEINGKTYMIAEFAKNTAPFDSQLYLWKFDGPFDLLIKLLPY